MRAITAIDRGTCFGTLFPGDTFAFVSMPMSVYIKLDLGPSNRCARLCDGYVRTAGGDEPVIPLVLDRVEAIGDGGRADGYAVFVEAPEPPARAK